VAAAEDRGGGEAGELEVIIELDLLRIRADRSTICPLDGVLAKDSRGDPG
jgi:hypothetical protein